MHAYSKKQNKQQKTQKQTKIRKPDKQTKKGLALTPYPGT